MRGLKTWGVERESSRKEVWLWKPQVGESVRSDVWQIQGESTEV